ncbi:hypothetical protein SAMN05877753_1116 [Bacillus oleivorans]|uniref:Uncharacterized protein n=1 Tax=Bacillus oleivorans TaxID=1448271 RepID=A0A285D5N1_9BACI|nr:hypothetical protein [Bacillus oleivorans]SNX75112.1 hypothetical protein SAMN05877753_1116 [Bacillus oleivorans]
MSEVIIDLVKSFEGIIGAVLGSVITLITTHFLKKAGTITSNIIGVEYDFRNYQINGQGKAVETVEMADHASIEINIDFFNNSESYKSINDLRVSLYDDNKQKIFEVVPNDEDTRRRTSYGSTSDKLEYLNISPGELVKKTLSFGFHSGNIELLKITEVIRFTYSIQKNKASKKKKISHNIIF